MVQWVLNYIKGRGTGGPPRGPNTNVERDQGGAERGEGLLGQAMVRSRSWGAGAPRGVGQDGEAVKGAGCDLGEDQWEEGKQKKNEMNGKS